MALRLPKLSLPGTFVVPWTRLAKEVGVIVLGVLIALGFGEVATSLRERKDASEARKTVRAELADNAAAMGMRLRTEPCIDRRFSELTAYLDVAARGPVERPPLWLGRPQIWLLSTTRWDTASQAGRSALFSADEQQLYAQTYAATATLVTYQIQEQMLWAQLRSLEGQKALSDTTIATMRSVLSQAKLIDWQIRASASQIEDHLDQLDIPFLIPAEASGKLASVCVPIDTPRPEATRRLGGKYGQP